MKSIQGCSIIVLATSAMIAGGCAKKVAAVKPTPPVASQQQAVTTSKPTPAPVRAETAQSSPAVPAPKPRYPDAATRARIDELLAKIEDAYFDYDRFTLRADAMQSLAADAGELKDILKNYPDYKLTIEGHADERGSAEYNLALGDRRAKAAKDYLVGVGIPADQLGTVSYGKERPACSQSDESCWQKNRRIHIAANK